MWHAPLLIGPAVVLTLWSVQVLAHEGPALPFIAVTGPTGLLLLSDMPDRAFMVTVYSLVIVQYGFYFAVLRSRNLLLILTVLALHATAAALVFFTG